MKKAKKRLHNNNKNKLILKKDKHYI